MSFCPRVEEKVIYQLREMYSFTFIVATQGTTLYGLSKTVLALLVDTKESKTVPIFPSKTTKDGFF